MSASQSYYATLSPVIDLPSIDPSLLWWQWVEPLAIQLAVTVTALALVRRWPYLILAGAVLGLPELAAELGAPIGDDDLAVQLYFVAGAAGPLVLIGVLAAAQSLIRDGRTGWGAAVAGAAVGAQLFGAALPGAALADPQPLRRWHLGLTVAGMLAVAPAVLFGSAGRAGAAAAGEASRRVRLVVAGGLAVAAGAVPYLLTTDRVAAVLGIDPGAVQARQAVAAAVIGVVVLLVGILAVLLAGSWAVAGALTAALAQVAIAVPMILAVWALQLATPQRWAAAGIGVALGVIAAASRWRVPLAAAGAVLCAVALFTAVAATGGAPDKLLVHRQVSATALLLVGLCATATVLVGGAALTPGRRGSLPAVLGPITAALVLGNKQLVHAASGGPGGLAADRDLGSIRHATTFATMLLTAAAALAVLYGAEVHAAQRAGSGSPGR